MRQGAGRLELIDSHAHLDMKQFDSDRDEVLDRAMEAGLTHIITIGTDVESSSQAVALSEKYDFISATIGYHPHDARHLTNDKLDRLRELARSHRVVGFGEIGLDFFKNYSPHHIQRKSFDDLINLGVELELPLIIHDREAHEQTFDQLFAMKNKLKGGVIHCFSGDYNLARRYLDLGFHISFPGWITFPKLESIREVAARLPLDSLLVETDCPFLAPVPKRGKRNEPGYVRYTAAELARVRNQPVEEVASATTKNARDLF
ncbi:MAG: TatD family hydrolase, partial [Deltaproteobacteria bacterium]|nr:TatD family hydrolase [Deltaproteobacteria bacterium]